MIPAAIATSVANLDAGIKAAFPLTSATSQALGQLQAQANALVLAVSAALAADDALISPAALDSAIATDLAIGNLADIAKQLKTIAGTVLEDYTLANLQGLAQRIQTNLLNVGA